MGGWWRSSARFLAALGETVHHLALELVDAQDLFLGQEFAVDGVIFQAQVQNLLAVGESVSQNLPDFFVGHRIGLQPFAGAERPYFLLESAIGVDEAFACRGVHRHFSGDVSGLRLGQLLAGEALFVVLCGSRAAEGGE